MHWRILIPLTSIVSSLLAISVIWWAWQRRKERESYYRYELMRLMLERAPDGVAQVTAWQREQETAGARKRMEDLRLAAWVLLLGGLGALAGLRFRMNDDSLFGWIPIGTGMAILLYLALARREQ